MDIYTSLARHCKGCSLQDSEVGIPAFTAGSPRSVPVSPLRLEKNGKNIWDTHALLLYATLPNFVFSFHFGGGGVII